MRENRLYGSEGEGRGPPPVLTGYSTGSQRINAFFLLLSEFLRLSGKTHRVSVRATS